MPARQAEAIILRTYPLRESDRIVSFFTREYGKCRGVSRGARRSKSGLAAALQPLTQVRMAYFERAHRELVAIDRCEVMVSMLEQHAAGYENAVVLGYIAEIADRLLPEHEVNDAVYRLLLTVLEALRGRVPLWLPVLYNLYWMVRLGGFLPDFDRCGGCGHPLAGDGYWHAGDPALLCATCRHPGASTVSQDARTMARVFARTPLAAIDSSGWAEGTRAIDLRRFLHHQLEQHLEQRLKSWQLIESIAVR